MHIDPTISIDLNSIYNSFIEHVLFLNCIQAVTKKKKIVGKKKIEMNLFPFYFSLGKREKKKKKRKIEWSKSLLLVDIPKKRNKLWYQKIKKGIYMFVFFWFFVWVWLSKVQVMCLPYLSNLFYSFYPFSAHTHSYKFMNTITHKSHTYTHNNIILGKL